jgi:4a-hydroxytetrahydrobiopterin dehydratase
MSWGSPYQYNVRSERNRFFPGSEDGFRTIKEGERSLVKGKPAGPTEPRAKGATVMAEQLKVYGPEEVQAQIQARGLTDWYLEDGWLRRKYNTDGWPTTLMLTNAIGYLCEAAYHHADLAVTWGKLWVKLKTHSAGGITDKDFALARKIEEVVLWRPEAGGPLEGSPNKFVHSKK